MCMCVNIHIFIHMYIYIHIYIYLYIYIYTLTKHKTISNIYNIINRYSRLDLKKYPNISLFLNGMKLPKSHPEVAISMSLGSRAPPGRRGNCEVPPGRADQTRPQRPHLRGAVNHGRSTDVLR